MLPVTAAPRPGQRSRLRVRVGLATLAASLLLAGSAAAQPSAVPAASPPPNVFGIGPSTDRTVDGRPYYYFVATPGVSFTDHVAVLNIGSKPLTLSVYATDADNAP